MQENLENTIQSIHCAKPIILNITNSVTTEFVANTLLALGATPIMSSYDKELPELIQLAHGVSINIGTLDDAIIQRTHLTADLAQQKNIPVVLDPVGAGATQVRTQTAQELIEKVDIVRGNASEILALAGCDFQSRGVDSANASNEAKEAAIDLAKTFNCIVVVSGSTDIITDGTQLITVDLGSPLMAKVTGMGCTQTAAISAFCAVANNYLEGSFLAAYYYGLCGQQTAEAFNYPGSFRVNFLDNLSKLGLEIVAN